MTLELHELPEAIRETMDKTTGYILTRESVIIDRCPQCGCAEVAEEEVESPPEFEGKSLLLDCEECDWSDALL